MVRLLSPTSLSKARRTSPKLKGRPKKGSREAKEMMARVRAAKKGGKRKSPMRKTTRRMRSPTAVASPTTLSKAHHMRGPKHYSPTTLSSKRRMRKSTKGRKATMRKGR